MRKLTLGLASLMTLIVAVGFCLPLIGERLLVSEKIGFRTQFLSFQLQDENGHRHLGFLCAGHAFKDMLFFEYGFQAPPETDLTPWQQPITGLPRQDVKEKDGFIWADQGHLWADFKTFGESPIVEGSRLGLDPPLRPNDQLELTVPGAPWDIDSKELSFFGRYPDYDFRFENENFHFDLRLKAGVPGWYQYNDGVPFKVGDFGTGSMNELTGQISGTIVHKQTGKRYAVSGTGLMENAVGLPWSWIEWGAHDWNDFHFPGGWSGSLWKAKDDWQFGYHARPHLGWMWDPERNKFLSFTRVELVDVEYVRDPTSGLQYPRHAVWRAFGPDGTFELRNTNLTFKPRESRFPLGPFEFALGMSYGNNLSTARLIRRDGSVVELKDGIGTMEHFNPVIPDYAVVGPLLLVLLVLAWGAHGIAVRRAERRGLALPITGIVLALLGIWLLDLMWSLGA